MNTRWVFAAIVALLLFASVRAPVATRTDGFTIDEPWHIVAGVSHLRSHDYRLNPEQPPFVKLIAAASIPAFRLSPLPGLVGKEDERRFIDKVMFLENDADETQRRVRLAMTIMNGLLLALLAAAIWRTFGPAVAIGAIAFLAIDPSVAANIPVVMTDLPIALAGTSAVLFTVAALWRRRVADLILAILSFAMAIGTKHSGPIVAVALVLVCIVVLAFTRNQPRWKFALTATALLFAGAWALLWAMYGFRFLETNAASDQTNTALALKIGDVRSGLIRTGLNLAATTHAVPRPYIWGLADTVRAGAEGRGIPVFLLGKVYRDRGPFYHWPVVLFAKLPLGLTLLILLGTGAMIRYGIRDQWRLALGALAIVFGLFLFFLMRGAAYASVRHALPLFPPLAVVGGIACAELIAHRSRPGMALIAIAFVGASISALPRLRPWEYYNEAFGGPDGAYRHFNDEGIDVGQRTKDLARYCKQQLEPRGIKPYVFYALSPQEEKSRHLLIHSSRAADVEASDDPHHHGNLSGPRQSDHEKHRHERVARCRAVRPDRQPADLQRDLSSPRTAHHPAPAKGGPVASLEESRPETRRGVPEAAGEARPESVRRTHLARKHQSVATCNRGCHCGVQQRGEQRPRSADEGDLAAAGRPPEAWRMGRVAADPRSRARVVVLVAPSEPRLIAVWDLTSSEDSHLTAGPSTFRVSCASRSRSSMPRS